MKTLFLHIGTPKTATTSLQHFFKDNHEILEKNNFCYPIFPYKYKNTNIARNGHFLIGKKYDNEGTRNIPEEERILREGIATIQALFQEYDNVLLSDEGLWTVTYSGQDDIWDMLQNEAEETGFSIKVIVYLRRQDEFVSSWWNQKVKMGKRRYSTTSWNEFIQNVNDILELNYYRNLERISNRIGKENVIVRRFGKRYFKNKSIYEDFFDALGLEFTEEYRIKEEERNKGLNGSAIEIKRILNDMPNLESKDNVLLRKMVMDVASARPENRNGSLFSEEEAIAFLEQYLDDNRKIMREYLGKEEDLFDMRFKKSAKWDLNCTSMEKDLILLMGNITMNFRKENEMLKSRLEAQEEELEKQKQAFKGLTNKLKHPIKTVLNSARK